MDTISETQKKLAVMQAFDEGAEIEYRSPNMNEWCRASAPIWDWSNLEYRIKPKVKRKLYLWRYKDPILKSWYITPWYTEEFPPTISATAFERIDYTVIEVD